MAIKSDGILLVNLNFSNEIALIHAWGRKIALLHDGNFRCRLILDWLE